MITSYPESLRYSECWIAYILILVYQVLFSIALVEGFGRVYDLLVARRSNERPSTCIEPSACIDRKSIQLRSRRIRFERSKMRYRNRSGELMPLIVEIERLEAIVN